MTVDVNLKWDQYVIKLPKNIRQLMHNFLILRDILSENNIIIVCKDLIESLIRYGLVIWGGLFENSVKQLNTVQNHILKIIFTRCEWYPTQELYSEKYTECLYIECRRNVLLKNNHKTILIVVMTQEVKLPNL